MRLLFITCLILVSFWQIPQIGYAACDSNTKGTILDFLGKCQDDSVGPSAPSTPGDGGGLSALRVFLIVLSDNAMKYLALFAVGVLVYAGIQYTFAAGDSEKLKNAKQTAIYAFIGLVLALASWGIIFVFVSWLYGTAS